MCGISLSVEMTASTSADSVAPGLALKVGFRTRAIVG